MSALCHSQIICLLHSHYLSVIALIFVAPNHIQYHIQHSISLCTNLYPILFTKWCRLLNPLWYTIKSIRSVWWVDPHFFRRTWRTSYYIPIKSPYFSSPDQIISPIPMIFPCFLVLLYTFFPLNPHEITIKFPFFNSWCIPSHPHESLVCRHSQPHVPVQRLQKRWKSSEENVELTMVNHGL